MATNQDRYFKPNPVIGDSSKLRFSQAYNNFNLDLFNSAAKSDKKLSIFIQNLQAVAEAQKKKTDRSSIAPLLIKSKLDSPLFAPRTVRLQPSPNAPNTSPALSLAAA